MEPPVIAALIAATASLLVAGWNFIATRRNQHRLEDIRQQNAIELEQVRAQLQRTRATEDARQSYEFEARKRLYTTIEPLLFELTGAAESAFVRITDLARAARTGRLEDPNGWLSDPDQYFLLSTAHRLTVPLSITRIWQRQLTLVDLNLDPLIRFRFAASKRLMLSWSEDFALASAAPSIVYDPTLHGRQGMYIGEVERLADALIVEEANGRRVMSFGQFEAAHRSGDPTFSAALAPLTSVLRGFHPGRRPVTWRILIAQAHLYQLLLTVKRDPTEELHKLGEAMMRIPAESRSDFDWGELPDGVSSNNLSASFAAAEAHLLPELRRTLDTYST
ncbi:hypothetical protein ACI79G_07940 [Geodermatophilus sp. SYSU D00779]